MTTYIDIAALGPTVALAIRRAKSLGLPGDSGLIADGLVAKTLGSSLRAGDVVYTRPQRFPLWRLTPTSVRIVDACDTENEDPLILRTTDRMVWALAQEGLGWTEAVGLAAHPPKSERHKHAAAWKQAQVRAGGVVVTEQQKGRAEQAIKVAEANDTSDLLFRWTIVQDEDTFAQAAHDISQTPLVGLDIETDVVGAEPNETKDVLVGIGIACGDRCYYLPSDSPWPQMLFAVWAASRWVGSGSKYDYVVLRRHGLNPTPPTGDSVLIAYLDGRAYGAGLKHLVKEKYGYEMATYEEVAQGRRMSEVPVDEAAPYCCGDAWWARKVVQDELGKLEPRARRLYEQLDVPLIPVLADMELAGIELDVERVKVEHGKVCTRIDNVEKMLRGLARESGFRLSPKRRVCKGCRNGKKKRVGCLECRGRGEFFDEVLLNPSSMDQIAEWFHVRPKHAGGLRLPVQAMVPSGKRPSIDMLALIKLRDSHPAARLLIDFKQQVKERGYLESWTESVGEDGRIHSTFTNSAVASGRLSSQEPNMQQVARPWRRFFRAAEGYTIVAADLSQVEVRVAAARSKDKRLMEIMQADPSTPAGDLHGQNVQRLFGIPYEEQKKHKGLRVAAKTDMFGAMYGGAEATLLEQRYKAMLRDPDVDIPIPTREEVRANLRLLHQTYPRYFKEYKSFVIQQARDVDDCTFYTLEGRPRRISGLVSAYKEEREAAEREGINHGVQGTVGDMMKRAMIRAAKIPYGRILLQVHDELVCEVLTEHVEEYILELRAAMELGQPLKDVPLIVEIGTGRTWLEAQENAHV